MISRLNRVIQEVIVNFVIGFSLTDSNTKDTSVVQFIKRDYHQLWTQLSRRMNPILTFIVMCAVRLFESYKTTGNMWQETIKWTLKITSDLYISPDPNNAKHHCYSCNWTYFSQSNYFRHLERVHEMIITKTPRPTRRNPNILPDPQRPKLFLQGMSSQAQRSQRVPGAF